MGKANELSAPPSRTAGALAGVFGPRDAYRAFLRDAGFPSRAVSVEPEGAAAPRFLNLRDEPSVQQAMLHCFCASPTGRVVLRSGEHA